MVQTGTGQRPRQSRGQSPSRQPSLLVKIKRDLENQIRGLLKNLGLGDGPFSYPVPWASGAENNFIETPVAYRARLTAQGFAIVEERDRRDFATDLFRALQASSAQAGGGFLTLVA
jgi:hypothetical protein